MITDLNAEQLINKYFQERSKPINELYNWEKDSKVMQLEYGERFITCVHEMGVMLRYVAWDGEEAYQSWLRVFECLIDMSIFAGKTPIATHQDTYPGYGFEHYPQHQRQMYIIHHMENFIKAQTVRLEPILWIEVGNEAGITDIKF